MNKERYSFPEPDEVAQHRMMRGESITPYEEQERNKAAKKADAIVKTADAAAKAAGPALTEAEIKDIWQEAFLDAEIERKARETRPDNNPDFLLYKRQHAHIALTSLK